MNGTVTGGRVNAVIMAYPGVEELDLFGSYVPLVKASGYLRVGRTLAVSIAAAESRLRASGGTVVQADQSLEAVAAADAVIVPGGRGVHAACRDSRYREALIRAHDAGAFLYAVCSGAFLIAGSGLAEGRALAIHQTKQRDLAGIAHCRAASGLVRDGRICSIGGYTERRVKGVDMAFQVLRDWASETVQPVADRLETRPGEPALELCP